MLGKVTVIALTAAPIFFLLSAFFARHDQAPVSVEPTSHAPEASTANTDPTTPRLTIGPGARQLSASEMLRPQVTVSLLNLKRSGTGVSPNTETTFFAPSTSGAASQAAVTIPGLEAAGQVAMKSATTSADVGPTKLRASAKPSQAASADATAPEREERSSAETGATSADSHDDLAWPDQWLPPRTAVDEKQNKAAKVDKSKKHSPHVRIAQKERRPSVPAARKDLSGPDDDPSNTPPIFQPNIEDGSN